MKRALPFLMSFIALLMGVVSGSTLHPFQPAAVFAQEDAQPSLKHVSSFPLSTMIPFDVFVMDDYAYITNVRPSREGISHVLEILDISDPTEPKKVGEIAMSLDALVAAKPGIYVADNYAYMPSGNRLHVIHVKDPQNPQMVGSVEMSTQTGGVCVIDGYAYVLSPTGLQVVDVSDPQNPNIRGGVESLQEPRSIYVLGNYAYVATWRDGLQVVDVKDPQRPKRVGNISYTGMVGAESVYVVDNYAYVVGEKGTVYTDGSWTVEGGLLHVIDISDPQHPTIVGSVEAVHPNTLNKLQDVFIADSYAYVAGSADLQVIDISDPKIPKSIASANIQMFAGGEGGTAGVHIIGDYAYVVDGLGLQVVDISNPQQPKAVGSTPKFSAFGVHVVGNYAYVADLFNTLLVVDVSDRQHPKIISNVDAPIGSRYAWPGIYVEGSYAYVTTGTSDGSELCVIDISEPDQLMIVGRAELPGSISNNVQGVHVIGNRAYVVSQEGLHVIDVREASQPRGVGTVRLADAQNVYVMDKYAYVAAGWEGLQVIDVSNPQRPNIVGGVKMPVGLWGNESGARDVCVVDNYAYVAAEYSGLQVIDVSDPQRPKVVAGVDTYDEYGAKGVRVHVDGELAYVGGKAGIAVIDISNPLAPKVVDGTWIFGYVGDIYVAEGYVYVAGQVFSDIFQVEGLAEVTAVEEEGRVPNTFVLHQSYPNPFNAQARIGYELPKACTVYLTIYNALGQKATTLVSGSQEAGHYKVVWDGRGCANGIYLYRLEAGSFTQTRRMVLLK